jgi:SDR family mycofactocin-dependent oxidoreductase
MGRVSGKVAFITGAGMGQGRSHAVRLAEEGADIIATDLGVPYDPAGQLSYAPATPEQLEETRELVEATGRRCFTMAADVRNRDAMQGAVQAGTAAIGPIDIVIANAGVLSVHASSLEISDATYDMVVDTNLKGVWNTIVATAPGMIERKVGGSMILVSSAAGIRGHLGYAHYAAAKHGVVGLMRAFANELAPNRIRVNSIHPTCVGSPGMGLACGVGAMEIFMANPRMMMQATNQLPDLDSDPATPYQGVPGLTEIEVSHTVLFLASDEARYITGITMPVDAGCNNKP